MAEYLKLSSVIYTSFTGRLKSSLFFVLKLPFFVQTSPRFRPRARMVFFRWSKYRVFDKWMSAGEIEIYLALGIVICEKNLMKMLFFVCDIERANFLLKRFRSDKFIVVGMGCTLRVEYIFFADFLPTL